MKYAIRVLPITMAGAGLLLALKVVGLMTGEGYSLAALQTAEAPVAVAAPAPRNTQDFRPVAVANQKLPSQEAGYNPRVDDIVTGATENQAGGHNAAAAESEKPAEAVVPPSPVTQMPNTPTEQTASASERQLLEQLRQRREEIEARNSELDVRENLLKAIEVKVEQRVNELKTLEQQLVLSAPAEEAKKEENEAEKARMKDLVIMYEGMKPKDAARIFDQLDMRVLVSVVMAMNPRKSSEIIAKMNPVNAQKLTVALASQNPPKPAVTALDSLPRIQGQRVQ